MHWLRDIPPLRVWPKSIPAEQYNCVQTALRRLGLPLRHDLERYGLSMVLRKDTWAGMALWDEELPLLAWSDFDRRRSGLDQSVDCRLYIYHARGGVLMGKALDELANGLRSRLEATAGPGSPLTQLHP